VDVSKYNDDMKRRIAVAFLVDNPEAVPENLKKPIAKIVQYQNAVTQLTQAIKQAQEGMKQLNDQYLNNLAGIGAIVDLIVDEIPADKIESLCEQYNPPQEHQNIIDKQVAAKPANVDMAGSSARNMPPPQLPSQ